MKTAEAKPPSRKYLSAASEDVERELTVDAWLPWDGRALRASLRLGLPLALARPRGRYAKAVLRLLDAIVAPAAKQARASESDETVDAPAPAEAALKNPSAPSLSLASPLPVKKWKSSPSGRLRANKSRKARLRPPSRCFGNSSQGMPRSFAISAQPPESAWNPFIRF